MVDLIAVMYHPLIKHCRSFDLSLYLMVYDQLPKINCLIHIVVDLFCTCHAKQYITVLISSVSVQAQICRIVKFLLQQSHPAEMEMKQWIHPWFPFVLFPCFQIFEPAFRRL